MRILIANDGVSDAGGVHTYLDRVVTELSARGHELALAYCTDSGEAIADSALQQLQRFDVGGAQADAAFTAVCQWAPDIVFSHNLHDLAIERRLAGIARLVKFMHGYFGTCISGLKTHAFPAAEACDRPFGPACVALFLPRRCGQFSPMVMLDQLRWDRQQRAQFSTYSAVVVASAHMRREFVAAGAAAERVHVNPLFCTNATTAEQPAYWSREDAAGSGRVAFLGRMTALKGGDVLIRAAHLASQQLGRPVPLVLVGDGPQRAEWEALAVQLRVAATFTGWLPGDARWELLKDCSLMAVPSVWPEPFGLVGLEANALGDIHKARAGEPCLLGSVKGNIGHTEGSAGIAAFIKACLALDHRVLPPTVFGDKANAGLRLEAHGLRLADRPQPLPKDPTVAGVSSFGLGGSNAHVVLQSAPVRVRSDSGTTGILTLSAPSEESLIRNAQLIGTALENVDDRQVAVWCRTTNAVKRSQRHRLVHHGDRAALIEGLQAFLAGTRTELVSSGPMSKVPAGVGILCSGQGAQYPRMTRPLYDTNARYREQLDIVASAFEPHLKVDLRDVIFGANHDLHQTVFSQPALFAVSYALGNVLLQSGVRPVFGIGHSVGEFAIACLAGVLSLDDAARTVAVRGGLMGSLPPGGAMAAIDLSLEQAEALVADTDECTIAAMNGPRSVVISGGADAVVRLCGRVRSQGGKAVDLKVSHAFHSPLMQPIVDEFRCEIADLTPKPAQFPVFSTVLGREVEGEEMDADYWADQICLPVRFLDAVRAAGATAADYVCEAGPRSSLVAMARQCGLPPKVRSLPLCDGLDSDGSELLATGAALLRDGFSPEVAPFYGTSGDTMHRIPPYAFATSSRFWFDGGIATAPPAAEAVPAPAGVQQPRQSTSAPKGSDVADAVLAVIADVGGYAVAGLARSSRLSDDLGYDSLLQLRLFERLRDEYPQLHDVPVVEVLPKVRTVGDIIDIVVERAGPPADVPE